MEKRGAAGLEGFVADRRLGQRRRLVGADRLGDADRAGHPAGLVRDALVLRRLVRRRLAGGQGLLAEVVTLAEAVVDEVARRIIVVLPAALVYVMPLRLLHR